jgi:hypothetical protein
MTLEESLDEFDRAGDIAVWEDAFKRAAASFRAVPRPEAWELASRLSEAAILFAQVALDAADRTVAHPLRCLAIREAIGALDVASEAIDAIEAWTSGHAETGAAADAVLEEVASLRRQLRVQRALASCRLERPS